MSSLANPICLKTLLFRYLIWIKSLEKFAKERYLKVYAQWNHLFRQNGSKYVFIVPTYYEIYANCPTD